MLLVLITLLFPLEWRKIVILITNVIHDMYHSRESTVTVEALQNKISATYSIKYLFIPYAAYT